MVLLGEAAQVEAQFGLFGDSANLCKIGARFAPNAPQAKKPFWMHLMVLLGEEAQLEARFGLFGHSANVDARQVHGLRGTYHMLRNQFGCTRWKSYMTCVIWNLTLVCLEIVLILVQDRCTFAQNEPQAQKQFWTHMMIFLGEEAQVEAWFGPFGDSANFDTRQVHGLHGRTICSKINLDTPDGTAR